MPSRNTAAGRSGSLYTAVLALVFAASAAAASSHPLRVRDDLGTEVVLAATPRRIVSLAPSNTEILFAVGLGDRLVGVTEWCNYPPAARRIEQVAGFSDLNVEKITAVAPDLVVAARGNDLEGLRTLRQLGIPIFALNIQSVPQMIDALRRLGRLTGSQAVADSVAGALTARLERIETAVASRTRPRVLWGYVTDPIYTAGPGSLIDDVIRRAGGQNVGRHAQGTWPQVSLETIVAWAPEVLLTSLGQGVQPAREIERLHRVDGWRELPAIRSGRVVDIDADLLTRAGPRLVEAVEILARQLHPSLLERP